MNEELEQLRKLAHTQAFRQTVIGFLLAAFVLLIFLFVPLAPAKPVADEHVATSTPFVVAAPLAAKAAIVYDLTSGQVLYAINADAQLPLASLTKLLTVESALSILAPDTPITVSEADTEVSAPRRFAAGDTLALTDLARLTLTASLNDGASAIAAAASDRLATSTPSMLSAAAAALGLSETYALNGSGLDLSPQVSGGYGSARDVALLAGALVARAPDIALATTEHLASATTLAGRHYEISNTDPVVTTIPHLLLSKTGYTDLAGGNLALVFDVGINHLIAVVVLGSTEADRFTDGQALVAATLAHFAGVPVL